MASPLAKGLFQRAIGQSGGSFFARILAQLDAAEQAGAQFARALGAPQHRRTARQAGARNPVRAARRRTIN